MRIKSISHMDSGFCLLSIAFLTRLSPWSFNFLTVVFMAADRVLSEAWVVCGRKGLVAWVGGAGRAWGE